MPSSHPAVKRHRSPRRRSVCMCVYVSRTRVVLFFMCFPLFSLVRAPLFLISTVTNMHPYNRDGRDACKRKHAVVSLLCAKGFVSRASATGSLGKPGLGGGLQWQAPERRAFFFDMFRCFTRSHPDTAAAVGGKRHTATAGDVCRFVAITPQVFDEESQQNTGLSLF